MPRENNCWPFKYQFNKNKFDALRLKLRIWSHLLKKSLIENFIFCAVLSFIIDINIDIVLISETKLGASFTSDQFRLKGFCTPYRLVRNLKGGWTFVILS